VLSLFFIPIKYFVCIDMSLGTAIHALNLQTNKNGNKYFFATAEAGEQDLFLSTLTVGGISTSAIGISGPAGNAVTYSIAPSFIASEFLAADQGLAVGGASTYWTVSTLNSSNTGLSLSTDRLPGSGTASIESYAGNGFTPGIEFLSRGVNSELFSTSMERYLSTIGVPGASAYLGTVGVATPSIIHKTDQYPLDISATPLINLFPCYKTNAEFGSANSNAVVTLTSTPSVLFSTPVIGLSPDKQALISINFINSLSTAVTTPVLYKVGFSTSTAYTNLLQSVLVPGGNWSPSGIPSATTPLGATLFSGIVDTDGINPDGTGTLYVIGGFAGPAADNLLQIKKGLVTEPTRNAFNWRSI
jgi:hypothetical protein